MNTLTQAREGRDAGMQAVAEKADRLVARWSDTAFAFLTLYAMKHAEFSGEDVSTAYEGEGYTPPHDDRAWGQVVRRAVKEKLIERHPTKTFQRARGHCSPGPVWVSKVFRNPTVQALLL